MNQTKLAFFASTTLALAAYGCGDDGEETTTTPVPTTTIPGTGGSTTTGTTTTTTTTGQGGSTTTTTTGQGGTTTSAGGMGQGGSTTSAGGMGGAGTGGMMSNAVCGDLIFGSGETCDDGNTTPGDGCDANCMLEPTCQDGNVDLDETCDDGNNTNGDGCSDTCQIDAGDCLNAVDLNDPNNVTVNGNVTTYSGDTTGSTLIDYGEASCGITDTSPSVIHAFTAPISATFIFETAGNGGITDTVMWAYFDCNGAGGGNDDVCNDDAGSLYSGFEATLPAGATIFIVVAGYDGEVGTYDLNITADTVFCNYDGMVDGPSEVCDDGNLIDGDGCNRFCRPEASMLEMEMNNSTAMANAATDTTVAGSIDPANDEDWYEVVMPAGTTALRATVLPSHAGNECNLGTTSMLGDVDSEVEILASDGTTSLALEDFFVCGDITATGLTAGDTYYVRVAANSAECPGCLFQYRVAIQASP